MTTNPAPSQGQAREGSRLTIGELARRTGLTPATLRTWETRYGFPRAARLDSGHRRYDERDVPVVQQVLRLRDAGVRLEAAVREASAAPLGPAPSVFVTLRRRHPALQPQTLRKPTLVALSRAIEDECCARAARPTLFGGFQRSRFFTPSAPRWRELARTARSTTVFVDRPPGDRDPGIRFVALPEDEPLRREWVLVCDAADYPAAMVAWELPGQAGGSQRDRAFECVWTLDPRAVRDAARVCADLAGRLDSSAAPDEPDALADPAVEASADLREATALFARVVAYVDRLVAPGP